jgi:ribosomal protein S18 acetylase RimI-like enzyme
MIKEAVPEDVDFLRSGLAELDQEMMELAKVSGTTVGAGIGPRIDHMLRSELFFIAVREQDRCGFLSVSFPFARPDKTLIPPQHPMVISTLFVLPKHRRLGIASKLLATAESKCRECGATSIVLSYLEGNDAAEIVYKKAGYIPSGRSMIRPLA